VQWAQVQVGAEIVGQIRHGLLVYSGIAPSDSLQDVRNMAQKIVTLRIFEDEQGKMNRSVRDARGGVLAVSNFTLLADARKGRRPEFGAAAPAEAAAPLHEAFVAAIRASGLTVASGVFGADMIIRSAADGPVNIILDMPPADTPQSTPADKENHNTPT
jgi:D-tyrosyl-tRNA(Tyr) deacylase